MPELESSLSNRRKAQRASLNFILNNGHLSINYIYTGKYRWALFPGGNQFIALWFNCAVVKRKFRQSMGMWGWSSQIPFYMSAPCLELSNPRQLALCTESAFWYLLTNVQKLLLWRQAQSLTVHVMIAGWQTAGRQHMYTFEAAHCVQWLCGLLALQLLFLRQKNPGLVFIAIRRQKIDSSPDLLYFTEDKCSVSH